MSAITGWDQVACSACRGIGREAIWTAARQMQGHDPKTCQCDICRDGRKSFDGEPVDLLDLLN